MDYNPFSDEAAGDTDPFVERSAQPTRTENAWGAPAPAALNFNFQPQQPADTGFGFQPASFTHEPQFNNNVSTEELQRREDLLRQKERELREREATLQRQIENGEISQARNWPFPCKPFNWTYHSIKNEIPKDAQRMMTKMYLLVIATWVAIGMNFLTFLIANLEGSSSFDFWVILHLLGIPGAWVLWYRSIYYGISKGSSCRWILFFIGFLAHTIYCGFGVAGFPADVFAGILFQVRGPKFTTAISGVISLGLWVCVGLSSFYMLKQTHSYWKGSGAEKRTQDAAQAAAGRVAVKAAVASAQQASSQPYDTLV